LSLLAAVVHTKIRTAMVLLGQRLFARSAASLVRPASRSYAEQASLRDLANAVKSKAEAQTDRAERTMRRFWKTVNIQRNPDGTIAVHLDKRPIRTPSGKHIFLPGNKLPVAALMAHEWENQDVLLKPHSLPMTSLTARAIDGLSDSATRRDVISGLLNFIDTDTVLFQEESPPSLVALQERYWTPIIKWTSETFGVDIQVAKSIFASQQAPETIQRLRTHIESYDPFRLAAFERAVLSSKSFLIALALTEGHISVEDAAGAAHVEVQSQIDRWGEVEDSHDVDHQDIRMRLGSAAILATDKPQSRT